MSWNSFYFVCFLVGFVLAALALFGGSFRLPHHFGFHQGAANTGPLPLHSPSLRVNPRGSSVSPWNFASAMAFLAWFGGMGFLLTGRSRLGHAAIFGIASLTGVAGGGLVLLFLRRVLLAHERSLDPADYDMVGVLGRVSVLIRAGGTGEVLFSQGRTRRCAGARSETGVAIARDEEVVVTRFEGGLAYVRLWEELTRPPARPPETVFESQERTKEGSL